VVRGLDARDVETRRAAADVLEVMGDEAAPAIDALTASLQDPDKFVRWTAARALTNLAAKHSAEQAAASVKGLTWLLSDQDLDLRLAAAYGLERFGPNARAAAPKLTRMINRSQVPAAMAIVPTRTTDPELVAGDPDIRIAAMRAVEAIDGDDMVLALGAVRAALLDQRTSFRVRQEAADVIGREANAAPEAVRKDLAAALGEALRDPQGEVRKAAAGALLRLAGK
jgi:HEAT repeat protein